MHAFTLHAANDGHPLLSQYCRGIYNQVDMRDFLGALASKVIANDTSLVAYNRIRGEAQELSTMVRYRLKPIIFLFNNGSYTIEVEIHDGPYNVINNWNYAGLIDVFNRGAETACLARQVKTAGELQSAIADAQAFDGLCFIEVFVDKDDCNKNLLKWGSYVGMANGEPPLSFQGSSD